VSQETGPALIRLERELSRLESLAVLLSGGVDSSLLAAAALRSIPRERVLAVTFRSFLVPEEDVAQASLVAKGLGLAHIILPFDPMAIPEVASNAPDRCYRCKRAILEVALTEAASRRLARVAEGSNADDMRSADRPGVRAVRELGILSPLADAGLTKAQVRELAGGLGLPNWDRPSSPCLATRFPLGHRLREEEAAKVIAAERMLRVLGLRTVRARFLEGGIRVEAGIEEVATANSLRHEMEAGLEALGLRLLEVAPYEG